MVKEDVKENPDLNRNLTRGLHVHAAVNRQNVSGNVS